MAQYDENPVSRLREILVMIRTEEAVCDFFDVEYADKLTGSLFQDFIKAKSLIVDQLESLIRQLGEGRLSDTVEVEDTSKIVIDVCKKSSNRISVLVSFMHIRWQNRELAYQEAMSDLASQRMNLLPIQAAERRIHEDFMKKLEWYAQNINLA